MIYEWVSGSGCARCASMDGFYSEQPVRPHIRCECEIVEHALECQVEFEDLVAAEESWDSFELTYRWSISFVCPDGTVHEDAVEETISVPFGEPFTVRNSDGSTEEVTNYMEGDVLYDALGSMEEEAMEALEEKCEMMIELCEVFE
jgi:hypothetical protein